MKHDTTARARAAESLLGILPFRRVSRKIMLQLALVLSTLFLAAAQAATLPPKIEGTDLARGSAVQVSLESSTPTVVVFLSSRCPCSQAHEPGLKSLAQQFPEVKWVGIHANADETETDDRAHFKNAELPFPVLRDSGSQWADAFGALKTPHAFVVKDGKIIFRGGVDNSTLGNGATKTFLFDALTAIKLGKTIAEPEARALGCIIRR